MIAYKCFNVTLGLESTPTKIGTEKPVAFLS